MSEELEEQDNGLYETHNIILKKSQTDLFEYCDEYSHEAKLFRNTMIYRCRQLYFAYKKGYQNLTEQEQAVMSEFAAIGITFPLKNKGQYLPGYTKFVAMFTATQNPDYYNRLPQQSSQQMIKTVLRDFKGYNKALKSYYKDPSKFTGKPQLPKYVKGDKTTWTITNQDAVIHKGNVLKLPKTKTVVKLGNLKVGRIKEVKIKPFYDTYKICIVEEIKDWTPKDLNVNRIIGIDLGIDNFVSASNNCGLTPFVIKGNELKSYNQWYNKTLATLRSELPENQYSSKRIIQLSKNRNNKTSDFYNKCASYLINYCVKNNIGTIVIGKNDGWKSSCNMWKINNQNFCFIAHSTFIKKLEELANKTGIIVIVTEESYTSKVSFLDGDDIPTYNPDNKTKYKFSGRRIHRGLYKSKKGILINADINGASNIIVKVIPEAFINVADYSYLYKTVLTVQIK